MELDEIWKDIVGYEKIYQISNLGNVKTLSRTIKSVHTNGRLCKEKILKFDVDKNGYLIVTLYKDNVSKRHKSHRLVALHFIKNPENKPQVNHKNGIKNDNRVENLEWCTYIYNNNHSKENNLVLKGESHPKTKLTNNIVINIRKMYNENPKLDIKKEAQKIGCTKITLYLILTNRSWKHLL